ncbi:MAG: flagellar basal body-associated FliL family protein [Methylococcaceae bacterium]|nr:flagellar basal body-associated FliL family protein [Methylococcaceae bacterium]
MAQMDDYDDEEEKPSKKPLIILILSIVLSLSVGSGGMFFFMKQQAAHEAEIECAPPPPPVITTVYMELAKPLIVNFPQGSSVKLVKITLAFSADEEAVMDLLKKNEPMILSNLLMLISAQSPEALKTHEGKVTLRNAVFDDVADMLEKTAPGSEIKEVFFTSLIMQ